MKVFALLASETWSRCHDAGSLEAYSQRTSLPGSESFTNIPSSPVSWPPIQILLVYYLFLFSNDYFYSNLTFSNRKKYVYIKTIQQFNN